MGAATLTGNPTLTVNNNGTGVGTLTLGAVGETGGSRGLTKAGPGTLVLTGTNTYTGTTTVTSGTLGGTGTIAGPITVSAGGTLSPGGSPGILTATNAVTMNPGSTFFAEINGRPRRGPITTCST